MGRHARTLVLLAFACLAAAAPAAAQDPANVAGKVAEVAERDAQATCRTAGGPCQAEASEQAIAAFEGSPTHHALVFQHRLGDDVGMGNAPWAATHNSYNSIDEMGPSLSTADSNHQIGMVEQLRLGIRSLEIDVHKFAGRNVVCHARGANEGHAGCSVERELGPVLEPIAAWVEENPGQVLMLYLEDHMADAAGYDAAAQTVKDVFGEALYAPSPGAGSGCQVLPTAMTRDDVLAAGAQVFVVSDCGPGTGWRTVAFDWGPMHDEAQPGEFDATTCEPFARERLSRFYEDSTGLSYGISEMGGDGAPAQLTPAVTAAMARCGIDHIGFDQLVPSDGRLDALVWSWTAAGPDAGGGSCAVQRAGDGRWQPGSCEVKRLAACRTSGGAWTVSRRAVSPRQAPKACAQQGGVFAAPRTGWENELLERAAGGEPVLLGLARAAGTWRPLDPR